MVSEHFGLHTALQLCTVVMDQNPDAQARLAPWDCICLGSPFEGLPGRLNAGDLNAGDLNPGRSGDERAHERLWSGDRAGDREALYRASSGLFPSSRYRSGTYASLDAAAECARAAVKIPVGPRRRGEHMHARQVIRWQSCLARGRHDTWRQHVLGAIVVEHSGRCDLVGVRAPQAAQSAQVEPAECTGAEASYESAGEDDPSHGRR